MDNQLMKMIPIEIVKIADGGIRGYCTLHPLIYRELNLNWY
jgi:hypothetical protein